MPTREGGGRAVPAGRAERAAVGRELRTRVPRGSHAGWTDGPDRPDALRILEQEAVGRDPRLFAVRRWRMARSPSAYLRGATAVMAADLARTPHSGLTVQTAGDAHPGNFGLVRTAGAETVFDVVLFEETLPGPWEWDLKRLAAGLVLLAREARADAAAQGAAVLAAMGAYRERMARYAAMAPMDVWADRLTVDEVAPLLAPRSGRRRNENPWPRRHSDPLVEGPGGMPRLGGQPLLLASAAEQTRALDRVAEVLERHRRSLPGDRRALLARHRVAEVALRVVGVASVGRPCWSVLMLSGDDEPLLLQVAEAGRTAAEAALGRRSRTGAGRRVTDGQRLIQAVDDPFAGWARTADGRDHHVRTQPEVVRSGPGEDPAPRDVARHATLCGWVLARAHARSGDPAAIAGYLGAGDRFDRAVAEFAHGYADRAEADHAQLVRAITEGGLEAVQG